MSFCMTCPAFQKVDEMMLDDGAISIKGMCKMDAPKIYPAGAQVRASMLQGSFDAQVGFVSAYPGTTGDDWCMRHPERVDSLKYDREKGFNRMPTLAEAQGYSPNLDE